MKQLTIRLACASVLTALALSGCAGGGDADGGRTGAFGSGYGSNGTRLFERDETGGYERMPGAYRAGSLTAKVDRQSGMAAGDHAANRKDSSAMPMRLRNGGNGRPVGNGYDGILPDGAGTSDSPGMKVRAHGAVEAGGNELRLGGIRITADAVAAQAGDGTGVLRVTSPAARDALRRLNRMLQGGRVSDRTEDILNDLRIVLKDAR